jgi:hypothetical protein
MNAAISTIRDRRRRSSRRSQTPSFLALAARKERGHRLMILLTVVTGIVDAVTYLQLGYVFVTNMTGNVVFLGFATAGANGLSVTSSLLALGASFPRHRGADARHSGAG